MSEAAGHPQRWLALGVLCLALGMVALDNTILNVAVPSISHELHASESDLQWVTTAYGLVFAGLLLPVAVFGDRRGRKGMLLAGLAIFGVASAAASFAGSTTQLAIGRGLMGVGGACTMPTTLAVLGNLFPPKERGQAIAIWSSVAGMAAGAGPIVGGLLLHRFWWGSVLIVNLPVAAIAFAAAAILVPRSSDPTAPRLDRRSSLTWWVALTAALVAIIEGPVRGWLSSATIVAGVAAVVFFAAFRYNEARSPGPLVDAKTARDPRMIAGAVTMAGLFFAVFGMQFVLTQWIQGSEGWSPLVAGLCFLPNAATSIVFALLNPRMVATRGHARVASMGLLLVAVGALGSAIAVHLGSIELVAGAVSFVGAGLGIASPSGAELIMSSAPPERAGSAAGVNETIVEATGALGVAVLGSVFAAGAGFAWPLVVAVAVTIAAAIVVRRVLSPTLARSTQ